MRGVRILRATSVLVLVFAITGPAMAEGAKVPDGINDVLWWLPPDTQMVTVAQGDFADGDGGLEKAIRNVTAALLSGVSEGVLVKPLLGRRPSIALEGSRRYRSPKGLGMMPYQGAQVLIFRENLGGFIASLEKSGVKTEVIAGKRVGTINEKIQDDLWSCFVAQPRANVLVYATDRSYLKELLERMETRAKTRALPENLPEWAQLDPAKPIWAIRHFDRKDSADDPTSPLRPESADAKAPDDRAVGFAFMLDPGKEAKVKYLTGNKDAVGVATRLWTKAEEGLTPAVRPGAPGVAEITLPLKGEKAQEASRLFLFVLLFHLGHGIYL